jgi:glycosyltransferase involved in cell wall biosynthesis
MKNILFVAYFYPPQRGIGGKRVFRWARALAQEGFAPFVLTTPAPPSTECDAGQETESPGVTVLRSYCPEWLWRLYYRTNEGVREQVAAPSPSAASSLLAEMERVVHRYYPFDPKVWFAPFAAIEALRIVREEKIDVALVTAAPVSSFLVGLALGAVGVPWMADFRDPWSFNFELEKKANVMRWFELGAESLVLRSATKVVFASDNSRKKYALLYPALAEKFVTLYSGASPTASRSPLSTSESGEGQNRGERSEHIPLYPLRMERAAQPGEALRLIHFGTFYGPRKLGVFIDALAEVIAEKGVTPERLQLVLLGNAAESDLERASALGIRGFIEVCPMMPYEEGMALLSSASGLLYCDPGREPFFVAGKFFDYLRAARPVFALSASSEIKELIERHRLGVTCDPDELASIRESLNAWIENPPNYSPVDVEELSAEHSAKKLAELLDA